MSVRVLVVDDDPDLSRWMKTVLAARGLTSALAYDAVEGFKSAVEHQPTVILVDWHMPAGGATELLRQVRSDPATAAIPVVVITADAAPHLRAEADSLGARAFLHKPIDPERLFAVIEPFLE